MRSPYHSRASRDYHSHSKSRNNRSASPSPPRPTQKNLKSIRITIGNVPGKPLSGSQLTSRREEPDFKGAEDSLPRTKEQKKIQIEIRRNIASNRISRSPVRRSIRDPNTVYISRSSEEGRYPIFDRDDIKRFIPKHPEKRVVAIVDEKRQRSRSRSPLSRMHSSRDDKKSVHDRLGGGNASENRHSRQNNRSGNNFRENNFRENDFRENDYRENSRVLDRDEIESRRPQVRPWETNPEFVPRNRYFFEHDNREDFNGFRGSYRGSYRGSGFRGRGNFRGGRGYGRGFVKRSRVDSGEWKHDRFREDDVEPIQNDS